jgi:hypothetical protein
MTRVLVVDDEPSMLRALHLNLTARAYEVVTAEPSGTCSISSSETPRSSSPSDTSDCPARTARPHRPSYLRIYMGQLRNKLEQDPSRPRHC